ncbi:TPA: LysR family transcriptional regulator [Serratia marcescens]|nr:LysR family transcriptional regulator [Serratia marcescens]
MDIRKLKYFVTIYESGSFSRAAQRLYISQPSLSQQISLLESDLKVQLLLRSSHGVSPTPSGEALYLHAKKILRQLDKIREEVSPCAMEHQVTGQVSIGLPTTVAAMISLQLFERIQKNHPRIHLRIFEGMSGNISEMLSNGKLDVAMLFRHSPVRGMTTIPLLYERLYLIGGNNIHKGNVSIKKVGGTPLVVPSPPSGLRTLIDKAFNDADIEPNIIADIDSMSTLVAIAKAGYASTILPLSVVQEYSGLDTLAVTPISNGELLRPISVCWSHAIPISAASLVLRNELLSLINSLVDKEVWQGVSFIQGYDREI